jgi:hypothetical protein
VCRFDQAWVEQFPGFQICDSIVKRPDGAYAANVFSEDWNFSAWCAAKGLKVFATRIIPLSHFGRTFYRNDSAWGEWETDRDDP